MVKKKTHKEFIKEINIKQPNIEILGTYIDAKTKIKCRCKIDGCEWEATPNNLLRDKGCPKCGKVKYSNSRRKTHRQFIEDFNKNNIHAKDIEILSEYIDSKTKIECHCKICGHIWFPIADTLTRGCGCPKCAIKLQHDNSRKTHDQFIKEISIVNPNIEILSDYINIDTPLECRCKIDGHIWKGRPDHLLEGHGCKKCAIRNNSGENNPNWNPNLTQEDREDKRNYPEYNKWRTEVYERDNYTCQVTGKKGCYLEAHHLYSYDKYYCLRTVVDNGITISKEIHKLFHSIYGRGNNTKEQWEEFINNLK